MREQASRAGVGSLAGVLMPDACLKAVVPRWDGKSERPHWRKGHWFSDPETCWEMKQATSKGQTSYDSAALSSPEWRNSGARSIGWWFPMAQGQRSRELLIVQKFI